MTKEQIVASSLLNSESNLSVVGAFQVIQDAATELTGELKIDGFTIKEKYNAFWVFAKTKLRFIKDLKWNDEMTIHSFISNISLAKMFIDVEVKNSKFETCLYSRTELCVLDAATEKIKKVDSVGVTQNMVTKGGIDDLNFSKFDYDSSNSIEKVKIRYTNIDFCHHLNNLEYIRLILNTYTVDEMESRKIKEIEIIYINQTFENETLEICKNSEENSDRFVLKKDKTVVAKCKIIFEK